MSSASVDDEPTPALISNPASLAAAHGHGKVVEVRHTVSPTGQVAVAFNLASAAATSSASPATATAAPSTTAPAAAGAVHKALAGVQQMLHNAGHSISSALTTHTTRSAATSTSSLPTTATSASASSAGSSSSSDATTERVKALEKENADLKTRIAELEERMKGSQVDSVPAS